jgi:hypothetical protein
MLILSGDLCRYSAYTTHYTLYTISYTTYDLCYCTLAVLLLYLDCTAIDLCRGGALYTIHHTPCTIHDTPYTIHHTPFTVLTTSITSAGAEHHSDQRMDNFLDRHAHFTTPASSGFEYGPNDTY